VIMIMVTLVAENAKLVCKVIFRSFTEHAMHYHSDVFVKRESVATALRMFSNAIALFCRSRNSRRICTRKKVLRTIFGHTAGPHPSPGTTGIVLSIRCSADYIHNTKEF